MQSWQGKGDKMMNWAKKALWKSDEIEDDDLYYPLNLEKYSDEHDEAENETNDNFKSACTSLFQNAKANLHETIGEIKTNTKQIIKILVILNIIIYLFIGLFIYYTV